MISALAGTWAFLFGDGAGDRGRTRRDEAHDEALAIQTASEQLARDTALLARIKAHDVAALDELLRAYTQTLFIAAMRIVEDREAAHDVVQDVFIWLWSNRERVTIRGSVSAYLTRAARNRASNLLRGERTRHRMESQISAESTAEVLLESTDDALAEAAAFDAAIKDALGELSPRVRTVFLMRVEQSLSYAEIADVLAISVTSVHKQMYRATKELMTRLAEWRTKLR